MYKYILVLLAGVVMSLYYFPIEFFALPGINTKMICAALGGIVYALRVSAGNTGTVNKDLLILSAYGVVFSLICMVSLVINTTYDNAYVTYIISMWVWLAGAYFVCSAIKFVHNKIDFELLTHYLVAVCIFQCIMAIWMDRDPSVKAFVDSYVAQGQDFLNQRNVKRLYGIGAQLDVSGIRMSLVLGLLANQISRVKENQNFRLFLYFLSFAIIAVIGNMIARTCIVGVVLSLAYLFFLQFIKAEGYKINTSVWKWFFVVLMVAIPLCVFLYNTDPQTRKLFRFAFEGFFSLVEKGRWEVTSNETLRSMVVWPDNWKTWIIGDGYFSSARNDPYFIGYIPGGYYMGTDVGYCRFIFYCGVTGLTAFSCYLFKVTDILMRMYPTRKYLMLVLLAMNFIIWMKVSTDIFLCLALLLQLSIMTNGKEENEEYIRSVVS